MEDVEDGAPWWIWLGLIIISAVSFWVQAVVTEERFVPALNVIAVRFRIPDDVAGATLMAAGASSPELFSSITALFVTHSSLGLGTIVGSEIFNQLIICAGAVFAAKGEHLQLDPIIVTREVGFYALSILLLFIAMRDKRVDEEDGEVYIYIGFGQACLVLGGYIAYVLVCANMKPIVSFFMRRRRARIVNLDHEDGLENHHSRTIPFVRTETSFLADEPAENFQSNSFEMQTNDTGHNNTNACSGGLIPRTSSGDNSVGSGIHKFRVVDRTKPSYDHGLLDMEINTAKNEICCFLWQRSYFYNKTRVAVHGWNLRWFTITAQSMSSVPNRSHASEHTMLYPKFVECQVDTERLIIHIVNPEHQKRDFYLMAPSREILTAVVEKMEHLMEYNEEINSCSSNVRGSEATDCPKEFDGSSDGHVSLISFPAEGSIATYILFLSLYPLRFLIHCTIPDVRYLDYHGNPDSSFIQAMIAACSCLVWFVFGSYCMVASLERLADLMAIPAAVVGVTVSAAGTSLPNYVASKIAAEKGFGNMAVSNAFGSNTFNIMVGLGLPWVLYTSLVTKFEPYHGIRDDGITGSIVILGVVLVIFVVLIIPSKYLMNKWHGVLFVILYVLYVAYEIGRVYV